MIYLSKYQTKDIFIAHYLLIINAINDTKLDLTGWAIIATHAINKYETKGSFIDKCVIRHKIAFRWWNIRIISDWIRIISIWFVVDWNIIR